MLQSKKSIQKTQNDLFFLVFQEFFGWRENHSEIQKTVKKTISKMTKFFEKKKNRQLKKWKRVKKLKRFKNWKNKKNRNDQTFGVKLQKS